MSDLQEKLAEIEASGLSGPNKLAATCELMIPELIAQRDGAATKAERKSLNSRLRTSRFLLRWAKTRAGYRIPGDRVEFR